MAEKEDRPGRRAVPEATPGGTPGRRRPPPRPRHAPLSRAIARWMFRAHLWLGVLLTVAVMVVCVTGILLNHKRALGLMPDVEHEPAGELSAALPLAEVVRAAGEAAGDGAAQAGVDRMDVRPSDGLVKVRFDDRAVTEVTVDLHSGTVLEVGQRNDVFLEKLHSGEVFGDRWILLSDATAVVLALLLLSGYWMWLYPRSRT